MDMLLEQQKERATRRKARLVTAIVHFLLLLLIFLPFLKYPDPPPGQEGVLISFGEPDIGRGDDLPAVGQPPAAEEMPEEEEESTPPPAAEPESQPEPEPDPEPVKPEPEPVVTPERPVQTDPTSDELNLRQKEAERKEAERKKAEQDARAEAERQAREAQEQREREEAEKRAREEAERKAREEEARKTKERFSGLFKSDTGGSGRGQTDESGNQGQPDGGDSDRLEGISNGNGKVGGGLANRGGDGPRIRDDSQATGRVVIKVCVDASGRVISAQFTQQGSTTNNSTLIAKAEANARKWTFSSGAADRQCGTITYDFKVK